MIFLVKYVAVAFAGGLLTSFAEYKFQYNLYADIKAIPSKVKALFAKIRNSVKSIFGKKA